MTHTHKQIPMSTRHLNRYLRKNCISVLRLTYLVQYLMCTCTYPQIRAAGRQDDFVCFQIPSLGGQRTIDQGAAFQQTVEHRNQGPLVVVPSQAKLLAHRHDGFYLSTSSLWCCCTSDVISRASVRRARRPKGGDGRRTTDATRHDDKLAFSTGYTELGTIVCGSWCVCHMTVVQ